jgi:pSer/pThr/pTyr-binding forkhead associated (FHA) protein
MPSFSTACGLADPLQLVIESQKSNERVSRFLHEPFAVIGRDPRADLVLEHSQVSRRHVYLQVVAGRAFWVDLGSRTGSRGERGSQKLGWLEGGRVLCIGPYTIRRPAGDWQNSQRLAQGESPRDIPLFARASSQAPALEVALEFLNGPAQSASRPVRRVLSLIGSASGCKFRLTDPSVSRFHGSLLQTPAGLWIVDLLGQKGITVNNVPARFSRLVDGDVLKIGRYQIRIRCRLPSRGPGNGAFDPGTPRLALRSPRQQRSATDLGSPDTVPGSMQPELASSGASGALMPFNAVSSSSKLEMIPPDGGVSATAIQSQLTESMVLPLVSQFGLMQQQMFDQFQQAMAMMVQMFGTMHRDQMEAVRSELSHLHELTEEFHALKNELAKRSKEQVDSALRDISVDPSGLDQSTAAGSGMTAVSPIARSPELWSTRLLAAQSPRPPVSSSSVPTSAVGEPSSAQPQSVPSPPVSAPLRPAAPAAEQRQEARRRSAVIPGPDRPAADSERDTVVWLHQRMAALQRERESRWQKILKLLPGMS